MCEEYLVLDETRESKLFKVFELSNEQRVYGHPKF